ncbi:unnamed protein product [Schistosoma margrebowiei]|uniref:Uncharacterized protein n=1 Tax=Schistosoma margrebowiei TaxID=48269 RepID=A0A183MMU3_9TREM|nr:unnamed protein product [Schistosoma margrebowiei]
MTWPFYLIQMKKTGVIADSVSVGLSILKEKSKIPKYNMQNTDTITLGETLVDVETFTYLGSIIDEQGGFYADVKERIGKTSATFLQLKNIWNSKQLSINIKITIFNANVKTVDSVALS